MLYKLHTTKLDTFTALTEREKREGQCYRWGFTDKDDKNRDKIPDHH
jgi:hypothetical protein